ncbi:TPA: helix-turn-helix transcriptional regulator [Vibrio alginolyticus]|uniref:helix-turn-helix domain-containing protein n=1 Tax=Vibrio alginolyticus TaxID=663 RepID=UPI0006A5BB92|nr:helix-turn-helix transcriptional regulator [Vibrio alginolyticus]EGQ9110654.1 helix-turn-helix domain-containing protein [Vibrio alginolyticus]EHA1098767.1 helix-turn-helix transcriptional regulator [Vibrio alginolyticus]EHA1120394.1 helix-turn-helix transcriptional regulator [Vibrio alginolyticus]ELH9637945.1 helix-turn-helix transcriptional regulator [Vibrio alginolyticus]ELI1594968.1 helix-turn-helix transcriptional regulator [Vibrio alginolyticus]
MIAWKQSLPEYEWLIHQIWYLEVPEGEVIDPKPHLIPNPRAHLLFTPPEQGYSYDTRDTKLAGKGCHLLTANEHLLLLEDRAPIKRIGITFRPEGLYAIESLFSDASQVAAINQCEWFDWLNTAFDVRFQQGLWQLELQDSPQCLLNYIKQHLAALDIEPCRIKPFLASQKAVSVMDAQALRSPELAMDIDEIAKQCACSRRTLERSFKQVVGLSVKQYQQMARLEQMILTLYKQQEAIDWASFSQQFGFSDQSHLIRTLKQQLRKTPSKYLKKRDLTIDIYGDFES